MIIVGGTLSLLTMETSKDHRTTDLITVMFTTNSFKLFNRKLVFGCEQVRRAIQHVFERLKNSEVDFSLVPHLHNVEKFALRDFMFQSEPLYALNHLGVVLHRACLGDRPSHKVLISLRHFEWTLERVFESTHETAILRVNGIIVNHTPM